MTLDFAVSVHQQFHSQTQTLLGGRPSLAGYEDLFNPETYADLDVQSGQKLLGCIEEHEADIRNNSCVLVPEVTQRPYYHSEAHLIRQNIPELQFTLLTLLGIGVINVKACLPLPNALVDIWHANATGDGEDKEGVEDGAPKVGGFSSIFPGYYTGRALHIHTKVFTDWAPQPNRTFKAGRFAHTGQFFFDDGVSETINKASLRLRFCPLLYSFFGSEPFLLRHPLSMFKMYSYPPNAPLLPPQMWPYSTNPIHTTLEKLGAIIDQGLVRFITMGINASASYGLA
ncbi:hypothetical protein FIBSPDRAFT_1052494 [Athelia psychrophila]|uniref:Aromatic compound dioxygenase n=1 Tax=Athelia psychrophila TaxID=1759441 RepID=A0A165X7G6_9AGAM|nr:hypothetical protein FIBSPDRAFT_1052494 [Fibularhizoctonia sp. CBS 109695]